MREVIIMAIKNSLDNIAIALTYQNALNVAKELHKIGYFDDETYTKKLLEGYETYSEILKGRE